MRGVTLRLSNTGMGYVLNDWQEAFEKPFILNNKILKLNSKILMVKLLLLLSALVILFGTPVSASVLCERSISTLNVGALSSYLKIAKGYLQIRKPIKFEVGGTFHSSGAGWGQSYNLVKFKNKVAIQACEYLAILTHEYSHLKQFQDFGSLRNALNFMEIAGARLNLKVEPRLLLELEADYLAGCVWGRRFNNFGPGPFQIVAELSGSFNNKNILFHGTSAQRIAAFRYGYFDTQNLCITNKMVHSHFASQILRDLFNRRLN